MLNRFGLLGGKLGHSFSPRIHAMLGNYEYKLYEKTPGEVEGFLRQGDFDGLNVTIPYKKTVLPLCATLSDEARRIGSVNTLVRRADGTLHGDNTDYFGFSFMLGKSGARINGKKALVLGAGGAAAAVRAVLTDEGAGEIVTVSRSAKQGDGSSAWQNQADEPSPCLASSYRDAQIIVNATPVGMYPENGESPVGLDIFDSIEAVFDLIYNPSRTELMLQAEDMGIPNIGGLVMLVAQAKRASELFIGMGEADSPPGFKTCSVIEGIAEKIERDMKNIALIGMPGCGRTTVGRSLSELTGRAFYDMDEMIEARAGKGIECIFSEDGEETFRDIEEEVLQEVSKNSGCVIATGGGVVKRPENRRLLRQNSTVVFIDRAMDDLPKDGRPLSLSCGVEALFSQRLPLYMVWSDIRITARVGVLNTAHAVKESLQ